MTTATITPTVPRASNGAYLGQAARRDTNWHEAADGNWGCLRRNNVERVAHIPTDQATPWHCYVQRDQRGPMLAVNNFATAEAALNWLDTIDGAYPNKSTEWHRPEPNVCSRRNLHGDLLVIIDTQKKSSRRFHCCFARNMGRGHLGQMRIVAECRSLSQAVHWFDQHPAG